MNIHEIINLREYAEETINISHELHTRFKTGTPKEVINFVFVSVVVQGKKLLQKQLQSGQSYCHECSRNGRKVYHANDPAFNEFRLKPLVRNNAKQLNRVAELIY